MPPYYAAGLTIRLETHEAGALEDTIVTANSGAESKRLLAEADLALSSGERLSEEPVDCLAEQGDSALKFLGKNQTMPFYCMAVNRRPPVYGASVGDQLDPASGADNENEPATASKPKIKLRLRSTRSSTHTALPEDQQAFQPAPQPPSSDATYPTVGMPLGPTRTPTPVSSIPMGQPLSLDYRPVTLKVQLDPVKSFCRSPRVVFKDLKMEVFFNGVLTHSTLVPARERNKPESLNHVFSGRRIARIVEANWILCPQQTQAKPKLSSDNFYTHEARAEERWRRIGSALREEVASMGTDEKGKIPPSGLFLRDLADLRMPVAVRDMQALTGLKLGTVDVVITLGQGRKEAPTGIPLREPQHLRNPGPSSRKPTPAPTETRMSNALGSITITDLESIVERPVLELRKNLKSLRTRGIMGTQPESFSGRQHGYWSRSQGPRRRLARAPVRAHDLSNLKPTIALSGSDFAVPTHYLQQKPPPSHPKLIVRLPLPSPSPTKAKSQRRSGSFSRPPAEDDEADRDFAPPTPKRQGSSGRRGRGQNWRFGLSRDPSSPSGWSSRPGSSAHTPSQTQPSPATQQAAASALIPSPSHAASAGNPKRKNTRMTADAAITRQPSLPPAAVFKTVPPSRKAPVPAMEPSTLSAHSRKDSGSVSLATRSRTSSPDKSSRALTKALTSATSTGPATPAAITYPAPPHPSLLKLNTCISSQPGFKTPTVPASRTQSRAPTPASTRRSTPASTRPATPSALIPEVDVPDTSQHCVITYKPGMVRQIRSERGGWFTEEEVLVGVRFIVCA